MAHKLKYNQLYLVIKLYKNVVFISLVTLLKPKYVPLTFKEQEYKVEQPQGKDTDHPEDNFVARFLLETLNWVLMAILMENTWMQKL